MGFTLCTICRGSASKPVTLRVISSRPLHPLPALLPYEHSSCQDLSHGLSFLKQCLRPHVRSDMLSCPVLVVSMLLVLLLSSYAPRCQFMAASSPNGCMRLIHASGGLRMRYRRGKREGPAALVCSTGTEVQLPAPGSEGPESCLESSFEAYLAAPCFANYVDDCRQEPKSCDMHLKALIIPQTWITWRRGSAASYK